MLKLIDVKGARCQSGDKPELFLTVRISAFVGIRIPLKADK